ncbi:MAG: aminoacyl-tRNA hydrolase [Oscillospiraceae bacterium]|nr:aminoacyl-tRNA hydrolase [Oscillospiraceae bacterium]
MISRLFSKNGVNWIVAGLGNPDRKYEGSRHNMGFIAIDRIAEKRGFSITRSRFRALTAVRREDCGQVLYMKPLTYMNLSGEAIGEAARFYKVPADHVIVLCDDVTLPAGTIRIRAKGEAGGHNGLKSVISCLGSSGFPRIKIGVGNDTPSGDELVDFVLGKPNEEDMKAIMSRMDDIDSAQDLIKAGQLELAQSRYNRGSEK